MSIVLQVIGWAVIAIGVLFGVQTYSQLRTIGLALNNPLLMGALGTVVGIIVTGIVFIAFGTMIRLLQRIKENTDRL